MINCLKLNLCQAVHRKSKSVSPSTNKSPGFAVVNYPKDWRTWRKLEKSGYKARA